MNALLEREIYLFKMISTLIKRDTWNRKGTVDCGRTHNPTTCIMGFILLFSSDLFFLLSKPHQSGEVSPFVVLQGFAPSNHCPRRFTENSFMWPHKKYSSSSNERKISGACNDLC